MSKEKWAGIVYGRTHHLDFRFIALPEDFGELQLNWASSHILATTQKPKKLSSTPRWSLFKNESHCIVGVTCMVRDLLGEKEAHLTKDDKDRPLYIFVGYAAKLTRRKYLVDLPPYDSESLHDFQDLYDHVKEVWMVKDFHKNSHKSIKTSYQKRDFSPPCLHQNLSKDLITKINYRGKSPNQVFLWQDTPKRNGQLWATSAVCSHPTSVCLGKGYTEQYSDNPFLNHTVESQDVLTVKERFRSHKPQEEVAKKIDRQAVSFTEVITNKVKEDIQVTYSSALELQAIMLNNFTNENETNPQESESNVVLFDKNMYRNFGFKAKGSEPEEQLSKPETIKSDWF
ncbi:MAG: hypothetical protein QNJ18_15385 [Xenococcaceae cyanobacterium MO_167.B52]|nr:hypothetical protein [Xenococcaceae cyanobacterium MO_167.B52]